ncbi:MAG: hypothetical protein IKZ39_06925 [Lachnospiraceae bacterium]|nr:hypothetical protein [Lachnospiraceae bacterium]
MVKHMSEIALQISSIKNLDMVNFYHLFAEGASLPGILAYYDNSHVINLCAADDGFPYLLEKIVEVYSREKEFNRIVADNDTKAVLERSISCSGEMYEEMLKGFSETTRPIFLNKASVHTMMLPTVKYIIEGILGSVDMPVAWNIYNRDWFGRGALTGTVKGKQTKFPYLIARQNDKMYRVTISGLIRQENTLTVDILHDVNGIWASFFDCLYGYEGTLSVDITGPVPMLKFNIERGSEAVFHSEEPVPASDDATESTAFGLSPKDAEYRCCLLPWGERIYTSTAGSRTYSIFENGTASGTIAFGTGCERLSDSKVGEASLGLYSFMLFDSPSMAELHFIDMGYPQSALYKEHYVGKCFTLNKGGRYGN